MVWQSQHITPRRSRKANGSLVDTETMARILALLREGKSHEEVADSFSLSAQTVRKYVQRSEGKKV